MENWLLLDLARYHQEEFRREAEAARLAALLEVDERRRLRRRLGRALINLGAILAGADAHRAEQA